MFYRDEMIRFWRAGLRHCPTAERVMLQITTTRIIDSAMSEPVWEQQQTIGNIVCHITVQPQGGVVIQCVLPEPNDDETEVWRKRLLWLRRYCRWRGIESAIRWIYAIEHMPTQTLSLWVLTHAWARSLYGILPQESGKVILLTLKPSTPALTCHRYLSIMAHMRQVRMQWHATLPVDFGVTPSVFAQARGSATKGYAVLSWQHIFQYGIVIGMGVCALSIMSQRFMQQQNWCDNVLEALQQPQALNERQLMQHLYQQVMLTYPPQTAWLLQPAYTLWHDYVKHLVYQTTPLIFSQPLPVARHWTNSVEQIVSLAQPHHLIRMALQLLHMALQLLALTQQSRVGQWMNRQAGKQFWQHDINELHAPNTCGFVLPQEVKKGGKLPTQFRVYCCIRMSCLICY